MSKFSEFKSMISEERSKFKIVEWPSFKNFLRYFAGAILLGQFLYLAGVLFELRQSLGLMYARGDDASHAVYVATKTKWWNMNGWYAYGPVYYRLTHTIAKIVTPPKLDGQTDNERNEMNHHFFLTIISLVSLMGLCYLISRIILSESYQRYLATAALASALLTNHHWSNMVITAHPDYLAFFMMLLSFYFMGRLMANPDNFTLYLFTAILWGLTASTKMIFVYFLPVTPFIWKLEFKKHYFKKLILFYVYMFVTYLIIGFPQNFRVDKVLLFMNYMSGFTRPIDWEFFKIWVNLTVEQFWLPTLVFFIICLIPNTKDGLKFNFPFKTAKKLLLLSLAPLALMYSRKLIHHYYHYPMIFGLVVLLGAAIFIRSFKEKIGFSFADKKIFHFLVFVIAVVSIRFGISFVPKTYYDTAAGQLRCSKESKELHDLISSRLEKGGFVLADPTIPFNVKYKRQTYKSYTKYIPDLKRFNATLLGLTGYHRTFFRPEGVSDYYKQNLKRYPEIIAFYRIFKDLEETVDPYGKRWKRIYKNDKCSYQLYERID